MTNLIHKFHRLIHEKYNDTNEISSLRGMIYLDEKRLCQLRTIINHDNDIEPHGLSFISDHPPVMYSTLIQVCLMRAALIRSKHELLSPTQVLTGQQQIQEPAQPQKGEEVKRKGKSRGDGKAQRRRGLLRRKGLDPD
ncbi:unnamed protein product [Rotaria sp. Silwood1]|nr:unnamed protein product [Rotaria sp. Silwood1]CAF1645566.1 unnamed protein product [Rotaria sp. Silwood1]